MHFRGRGNQTDFVQCIIKKQFFRLLVRSGGLEPPRVLPHSDLNAARLPIPPRPRGLTLHSRASPQAQEGKLRRLKTYAFPPPRHVPEIGGDPSGAIQEAERTQNNHHIAQLPACIARYRAIDEAPR